MYFYLYDMLKESDSHRRMYVVLRQNLKRKGKFADRSGHYSPGPAELDPSKVEYIRIQILYHLKEFCPS